MSLANKTFINNITGQSVKVIDTFENIAILDNKQKIDVSQLTDTTLWTPDVDPSDFFDNKGAYSSLLEKIKNIPTDNMVDESLADRFGGEVSPATNESAVIMSSEEEERAELARKYGASLDNTDALTKQQQAFSKYLDEDELPPVPAKPNTNVRVDDVQQVEVKREYQQPPVQRIEVDDPIITMFKKTKRGVNFNFSVDIEDKIPRLDFIEMMEDSYETSIIDFLADEFTNKLLNDPSIIRDSIKDRIKQLVYGGDIPKKEEKSVETLQEAKKVIKDKKMNASQRCDYVNKLESVKEIKEFIKGEKAKSVIDAAELRISELKNEVE
jgi:hypothetical protein